MSENKPYVNRFNTWTEFLDFCENQPTDMKKRESRDMSPSEYKNFVKADGWNHVKQLAVDGWPEGLKQAKAISSTLFDHVSSMIERVDVNYDIEGHSIDIARFVDGEPESWLKFENVIQEAQNGHKLIRITFNCSVSSGVGTDVIIRKGATIAALIELLEYSGHRVELTLCQITYKGGWGSEPNSKPKILTYVKLKEFDQHIDQSKLAYALAHPSVPRALMFSVKETAPEPLRQEVGITFHGGYGMPGDIPEKDVEDRGDIYVASSRYDAPQWQSTEAAEKWILGELEKQGVHLKKENTK